MCEWYDEGRIIFHCNDLEKQAARAAVSSDLPTYQTNHIERVIIDDMSRQLARDAERLLRELNV